VRGPSRHQPHTENHPYRPQESRPIHRDNRPPPPETFSQQGEETAERSWRQRFWRMCEHPRPTNAHREGGLQGCNTVKTKIFLILLLTNQNNTYLVLPLILTLIFHSSVSKTLCLYSSFLFLLHFYSTQKVFYFSL